MSSRSQPRRATDHHHSRIGLDSLFLEKLCCYVNDTGGRMVSGVLTPEYILQGYEFLKNKEREWLNGYGAKCSNFFIHQLAIHNLDNYCSLRNPLFCKIICNTIRPYNTFNIYDEICLLEWANIPKDTPLQDRPPAFQIPNRPTPKTKPASPFTGKLLKDFWHKHHMQAGFLPFNVEQYHLSRKGKKKFEKFIADTCPQEGDTAQEWEKFFCMTAHEATIGAYEARLEEHYLTGDWIVYAIHEGVNYYLTLGKHDEGDAVILERIAQCRSDFPFLWL